MERLQQSWCSMLKKLIGGIALFLLSATCATAGWSYDEPAESGSKDGDSVAPANGVSTHGTSADSHAGGHHNEFDLSHANAGKNLEAPEEFKSDLAIYTFVVFLLLMAVLIKFAWKPIVDGLAKREQTIAQMIEDARQSSKKAEQSLQQYQAKLAAAQEETRELMVRSRQEADALKDRILAEAQSAADREKERALADIRSARDSALQDIAQRSVDTAVKLASQIVRREVKPGEHTQLIRDALERFPSKN